MSKFNRNSMPMDMSARVMRNLRGESGLSYRRGLRYGPGAIEASNERIYEEIASRQARRATATAKTISVSPSSAELLDSKLKEIARRRKLFKDELEKLDRRSILVKQELEKDDQREADILRKKKAANAVNPKGDEKEQKAKRREAALKEKLGKPFGILRVVKTGKIEKMRGVVPVTNRKRGV